MRTVVNVKSGGKTPLSGLLHSAILLLMLIGLGRYVALIPNAVLAGILITVGISIIDTKGLRDLFHIPRADAAVLIVVLLLTIFVDLLQAVAIGMVISSVLFMKRAGDLVELSTDVTPVSVKDHELPWEDEKDVNADVFKKIHIMRLDGPLFFGIVSRFREQLSEVPDGVELVIIRMKKVAFMDQSGLYALEDAVRDLKERNIQVAFTMIQQQPMYMMKKISLIPDLVSEKLVFESFSDCAEHVDSLFAAE
jgi:SulP family sulfate permease